jgi:hypothetical protein
MDLPGCYLLIYRRVAGIQDTHPHGPRRFAHANLHSQFLFSSTSKTFPHRQTDRHTNADTAKLKRRRRRAPPVATGSGTLPESSIHGAGGLTPASSSAWGTCPTATIQQQRTPWSMIAFSVPIRTRAHVRKHLRRPHERARGSKLNDTYHLTAASLLVRFRRQRHGQWYDLMILQSYPLLASHESYIARLIGSAS